MNRNRTSQIKTLIAALGVMTLATTWAQTQGTAFTYQGQLDQSGQSADGVFDFQFVLFDSEDFVTGVQFAGPANIPDHTVNGGNFAVEVDFGPNVFGTIDLWLEIRVRVGASDGAFTVLEPRQRVTPVPLALYAQGVEFDSIGTAQIEDSSIVSSDVDPGEIQLRIGYNCVPGSSIRSVNPDGTVICETDSDTTYSAGAGLEMNGNVLAVDTNSIQARINESCGMNEFMTGVNSDGTVQCSAAGGPPADCSVDLVCPTPSAGKACIAGRLFDLESNTVLVASVSPESLCGEGAFGGPCLLSVDVFDALEFVANPAGATPLSYTQNQVDGCGRFKFEDITPSALGFATVVIDDAINHETSAHVIPLAQDQVVEQFNALAVRSDTVQQWTDTAGSPFGSQTFAERGVLFALFLDSGAPQTGVTITRNSSIQSADDFYFSDNDPDSRSAIGGSTSTGQNGAGLMVDSDLVNHSGTGGEPPDCVWPSQLQDAIPGVVTVAAFTAEDAVTGQDCN